MRLLFLVSLLAAASPSAGATQQAPAANGFDAKAAELDHLFQTAARTGGAYILHYRFDGRAFVRAYGSLDCAGTMPMRADAVFDSGSLTKNFTRAAIFKLVEQGRLKLDDRLGELFRGVPSDKRPITIAQLLSHRSGIPNFIDSSGKPIAAAQWTIDYDYQALTKADMLRAAWKAPLDFAPGTSEDYSNYGFQILAAVIETASGEPYETYVRRHVLLPLEMRGTGYLTFERDARPIVEQCREGKAVLGSIARGAWRGGVSWRLMGAGGMMTNSEDLQRWNAGIESGAPFRPDVGERFGAGYFGPSYRCRTQATAVGGSNGMTRSLILHLPHRKESLVTVATRREHPLPEERKMMQALCS